MTLKFTTLSDDQIRQLLSFLKADVIEKGEIERYVLSGKCIKIKISYYDTIIIESEKIIYHPEVGAASTVLTIENIQNCVKLYNTLIENN